jgi:hypothetical protein
MGLPDLYAFSGSTHRFVGIFSLMGLIAGPARESGGVAVTSASRDAATELVRVTRTP